MFSKSDQSSRFLSIFTTLYSLIKKTWTSVILIFASGILFYVAGRFFGTRYFMLVLLIARIGFYVSIGLLIIRLVITSTQLLRQLIIHDSHLLKNQFLSIVFCVIALGLGLTLFHPWYVPFMYGFRNYIKKTLDVSAIRIWSETINSDSRIIDRKLWPQCVNELHPDIVVLLTNDDFDKSISLFWSGGRFGGWETHVGPVTMRTPKSDNERYCLHINQGYYVCQVLEE